MSESKHHHCPYRGIVYERTGPLVSYTEAGPIYQSFLKWDCGVSGMLCDRCKEDRADARAGVGNRLLAVEEYAAAIDARASSTEVDVQAMSAALADAQTRLAQVEVRTDDHSRCLTAQVQRIEALESRLPGPQTRTQDLGTFDAQTGQRVDEPTQPGEARTCGNCRHIGGESVGAKGWHWCEAPLPMWEQIGRKIMLPADDATHCATWTPKEAKA